MKKKKQIEKREELISQYFTTPIWSTSIPEWVDNVNEACKPYLDEDKLHQAINLSLGMAI